MKPCGVKLNYFVIPLLVLLTALAGSYFTTNGMAWYKTIALPSWTPPGSVIGMVWTIIFILSGLSAIIFWNNAPREKRFWWVVILFLLNAFLNIGWSYIFFGKHLLLVAVWEAGLLELSVLALIFLLWPVSRNAALLLLPYAGWVIFATFLTYVVSFLNQSFYIGL